MFSELLGDLADLVLPTACAGCGAERVRLRYGACAACAAVLESLRPFLTAPTPPPPGFPPCVAVGTYGDELRGALLAYKERRRYPLAKPLGALLATAVRHVASRREPVLLVPVPSTAAAVRERYGDHMVRLATHAVRRLRDAGWDAHVTPLLSALPRPDSSSLNATERALAAESSIVLRRAAPRKGTLVVVDDIVTTGSTLATVTIRLEEANMQVRGAAVLAATRLRRSTDGRFAGKVPRNTEKAERPPSGIPNEG